MPTESSATHSPNAALFPLTGRFLLGIALLLTAIVYARTIRFGFVYDDWTQIVRNSHLQSARYIPVYFTEHLWSHDRPAGQGEYYRPVFLLWLLLIRSLFGLWLPAWHAASLLLHLTAVIILYHVARRLLSSSFSAGIAALLFASHPVNHESIAWVSSASEPLMAVFFLGAFLLYLQYNEQPARTKQIGSLVCFALALGSKETGIVLLPLLLLYEFLAGSASAKRMGPAGLVKRVRAAAGAYFVVASLFVLARAGALRHSTISKAEASPSTFIFTLPSVVLHYLRQLILPSRLSAFYDSPYVTQFNSVAFLLPFALLLMLSFLLWRVVRRSPEGQLAVGWILLPMLPPLAGIAMFSDGDIVHDRYLYLSTMGYAILVAWAIQEVARKFPRVLTKQGAVLLAVSFAFLFALVLTLNIEQWRDNFSLYRNAVRIAPRNIMARDSLANEFFHQKDLAGAIRTYQESLTISPDSWKTNFALGLTYHAAGDDAHAEPVIEHAIAADPHNSNQYAILAEIQASQDRLAAAEITLRRGTAAANDSPDLHFLLGSILETQGDLKSAAEEYLQALNLNPHLNEAAQRLKAIRRALETPPPDDAARPTQKP